MKSSIKFINRVMIMNQFVSKQVETVSYTVVGKGVERQQTAQYMAEFKRRLNKERRARKI